MLLPRAPIRRRHPGVAPEAGPGHARHRAGGCGVSAVHPTAPIGPLTARAASAGRCQAGSGPARAAGRSSPGPSRPAPVWTEGPTGFPRPGLHRPRLGPAEYGPRRRRRARAPAPVRSQAHTPARGHYLGLLRGRAGRHPPAPTALRADQPGSAVRSHDEGWHASPTAGGLPCVQRLVDIAPTPKGDFRSLQVALGVHGTGAPLGIRRRVKPATVAIISADSARSRCSRHDTAFSVFGPRPVIGHGRQGTSLTCGAGRCAQLVPPRRGRLRRA